MGPAGMVEEFEDAVAAAFGVKHVVLVTSGTAALHTALCALGVAEGDEVITVHMSGPPCDMEAFAAIGRDTGVKILEDCAQAHGGSYAGRRLGSIGCAAGFSMNESKQMSTGDGGFVTTDDDDTARLASLFRDKTYIRDGSVGRGGQPIPFFALNYRYTGTEPTRDALVEALAAEGLTISTGMSPANNLRGAGPPAPAGSRQNKKRDGAGSPPRRPQAQLPRRA